LFIVGNLLTITTTTSSSSSIARTTRNNQTYTDTYTRRRRKKEKKEQRARIIEGRRVGVRGSLSLTPACPRPIQYNRYYADTVKLSTIHHPPIGAWYLTQQHLLQGQG
jgi:hypothetical protein